MTRTLILKLADVSFTTDAEVCQMVRKFIEILSLAFKPFSFFWGGGLYTEIAQNLMPHNFYLASNRARKLLFQVVRI